MTLHPGENLERARAGVVFDIKRFATGDGPGIRTLIFLKGCPLQCAWCANPESQHVASEIMYYQNRCVECGRCIDVCPENAIHLDSTYGLVTDPEVCTRCGLCVDLCLYDARELLGETMSVEHVMRTVRRDRRYYDNSGGGVTITGGDPLFQCAFTRELLKACQAESIHTAMETCGFAQWECLESVLPHLDLLFYDVKHSDIDRHRELTEQPNDLILANLSRAAHVFDHGEIIVRIPVIPKSNDDEETLSEIFGIVKRLPNVTRIELLPYHRFGMTKYAGLGRTYKLQKLAALRKEELEFAKRLGESFGIDVRIDST